jgi:hypothetical protein
MQVDTGPSFLACGGDVAAFMRAHDWSASPLGPPDVTGPPPKEWR